MPSEQIRNQLVNMNDVLHKCLQVINPNYNKVRMNCCFWFICRGRWKRIDGLLRRVIVRIYVKAHIC